MKRTTTIIGIAGASGAGKSLFARQLHKRLRKEFSAQDVVILNEDSYYRDRSDLSLAEREHINYDHPDALEHSLLIRHLECLRAGQPIDVPQYDYATHNRQSGTVRMEPSMIVILEGILLLHDPRVRAVLDLKVFVDVPLDICLARRLRRDVQQRGRNLESVLNQYESTVRPMFFRFIEPSREYADLIIPRGGENLNALDVLYSHLHGMLGQRDTLGSRDTPGR